MACSSLDYQRKVNKQIQKYLFFNESIIINLLAVVTHIFLPLFIQANQAHFLKINFPAAKITFGTEDDMNFTRKHLTTHRTLTLPLRPFHNAINVIKMPTYRLKTLPLALAYCTDWWVVNVTHCCYISPFSIHFNFSNIVPFHFSHIYIFS